MIYCVGLPRCGGQTLHTVLRALYPGRTVLHSVESDKWDTVNKDCVALVECYAPVLWCMKMYQWESHTFIINHRQVDQWFASCKRMLPRAIKRKWNHPLWTYPESQWYDYYEAYIHDTRNALICLGARYFEIDATKQHDFRYFCERLGYTGSFNVNLRWPNIDKFGRCIMNKVVEETLSIPFKIPGTIL